MLIAGCSKLQVDELGPDELAASDAPGKKTDQANPGDPSTPDQPGSPGNPANQPGQNTPGNVSPKPGDPNTPSQPGQTTPAPEPTDPTITQEPIRRLSVVEYKNTLRDLFPNITLPQFDLAADEKSDGFTDFVSLQQPASLLVEKYFNASRDLASSLTDDQITQLVGCSSGTDCATAWITSFGQKAFRRPLTSDEQAEYLALFQSGPGASDFPLAVKLSIVAMLESPYFLYRPEVGALDGDGQPTENLSDYEIASRLSYLVWGTMPDDELMQSAAGGMLTSSDEVKSQLSRMLDDPKARDGIGHFMLEWLRLDKVLSVQKLAEDNWDDAFRAEVSESGLRFAFDEVFAKGGTAQDLMTSTKYPLSKRMQDLLSLSGGDDWATVEMPAAERSGILTHPEFLAAHGYGGYPSPVLRGVFVMDRILCSPPQPPPGNVAINLPGPPDPDAPATNRTGYTKATSGEVCQGCHKTINGFGFAFENYDTLGRYRTQDAGFEVDATGSVAGFDFDNAVDLAHQIADSDAYKSCVVKKWLAYATGGSALATDKTLNADVLSAFEADKFSLKSVVVALGTHERFSSKLVVHNDE